VENVGPNTFRIVFVPNTQMPVEWVDLHINAMNGNPQLNVRMMKQSGMGAGNQQAQMFVFPNGGQNALPITLMPGQSLSYFFTYCVGTPQGPVDCDTPAFSFTNQPAEVHASAEPARPSCPVISFQQQVVAASSGTSDAYKIVFIPQTDMPLAWVDLHLRIPGRDMENVRMIKTSANSFEYEGTSQPINIPQGMTINYFFTYCVATPQGPVDCDTPMYSFTPQQPQPPSPPVEETPQPPTVQPATPYVQPPVQTPTAYIQPTEYVQPMGYTYQTMYTATPALLYAEGGKGFGGPMKGGPGFGGPGGHHGGPGGFGGFGGPKGGGGFGFGGPKGGFGGFGGKGGSELLYAAGGKGFGGPGFGFGGGIGYGGYGGLGYGGPLSAGYGGYASPLLAGQPISAPFTTAAPLLADQSFGYGYQQQPILGAGYSTTLPIATTPVAGKTTTPGALYAGGL
jgi:hypothetical protein